MKGLKAPTGGTFSGGRVAGQVSANPAAGAEATLTVPSGKAWQVVAVSIQCVQGATQTPLPRLVITVDGFTMGMFPGSSAAQASSTTARYAWGPGLDLTAQLGSGTGVSSTGPIPELVLLAGDTITTNTVGIGANTDYGVMNAIVIEYDVV